MGWRLNRRLKALRDSHDGFAIAVRELNAAAARAEQGLADLRAATDEAVDELADRIEKGRSLATRLERLIDQAPAATSAPAARALTEGIASEDIRSAERRLGALLAAAREGRPERVPFREPAAAVAPRRLTVEDDLFEDEPLNLDALRGARR
jgi:ABC-type transporter Mla subunit MlaD